MNPMEQLRKARPSHLDGHVDERTRAAELTHAMSQQRERVRRRLRVRPVWGLSLAGAAAAVTAVAVVISGGSAGTAPRAPSASASASASAAPIALSAKTVLLAAAEQAERTPAVTGDWWHSVSVSWTLLKADKGGYMVADRRRSEHWTPLATGKEQWSRSQMLGAEPLDRAAWEKAGSPKEIAVRIAHKGHYALSTEPGKVDIGHSPLVDGDKVFWLGKNVTMKDLLGLPSEPDKLKAWLLRSYEGHDTESDQPMGSDDWLFAVTNGLIMDMPVTPQVRAAAFRMLADLDSIEVTAGVTDAEGRKGTAVSIEQSGLQRRLIIDESTGQALTSETVVVKPVGNFKAYSPGDVWNSHAVLESGWTDEGPPSE